MSAPAPPPLSSSALRAPTPSPPVGPGRQRLGRVAVRLGAWALAGVGLLVTFRRPLAPPVPDGLATDLTTFDPQVLAAVADWTTVVRGGFLVATGLELLVLAAMLGTRPGTRLLDRFGAGAPGTFGAAVLAGVLATLVTAPVRFLVGHVAATEAGLRTGSALRWVVEWSGAALLRVVLVGLGITAVLAVVRRAPRGWPYAVTIGATLVACLLLLAEPLVTTRLLLQPRPLPDGPAAAVVEEVLGASTLEDLDVVVGAASVRTTTVNAYVTGLGPSRTVVLLDTLLELPPEQVRSVVAHEIAHAEADDPLRGVLGVAAGVLPLALLGRWWASRGAGWVLGPGRLGVLGVTVVLVGELALAPVVTWQSRRVEAAADARSLELTDDPLAAVLVARGFVEDSLSDPTPPAWVVAIGGSHPTPSQRIRAAVAHAERRAIPLPTLDDLPVESR